MAALEVSLSTRGAPGQPHKATKYRVGLPFENFRETRSVTLECFTVPHSILQMNPTILEP